MNLKRQFTVMQIQMLFQLENMDFTDKWVICHFLNSL